MSHFKILKQEESSVAATNLLNALWQEIQSRYNFTASNPLKPDVFLKNDSGLWIAFDAALPIGSIAFTPHNSDTAELDGFYLVKEYRGIGLAQYLLTEAESYCKMKGYSTIKLRAGHPQPEALRFYKKMGYVETHCFGKWLNDPTAVCFLKSLI